MIIIIMDLNVYILHIFSMVLLLCHNAHITEARERHSESYQQHINSILVLPVALAVCLISMAGLCLFYKRKSFDIIRASEDSVNITKVSYIHINGFRSPLTKGMNLFKKRESSHFTSTDASPKNETISDNKRRFSEVSMIEPDEITYKGHSVNKLNGARSGQAKLMSQNFVSEPTIDESLSVPVERRASDVSVIEPDEVTYSSQNNQFDEITVGGSLQSLKEKDICSSNNLQLSYNQRVSKSCASLGETSNINSSMDEEDGTVSNELPEYSTILKVKKIYETQESITNVAVRTRVQKQDLFRESTLSIDESQLPAIPPKTPEAMEFMDSNTADYFSY